MKLKTQFALGNIFLVAIAIVSVGSITIYAERALLKKEIIQHHRQLVDQLVKVSEESFYQSEIVFLNFSRTLKNERGFLEAAFVDKDGRIRLHSNPSMLDKKWAPQASEAERVYTAPVSFGGSHVGAARLKIDMNEVDAFLDESTWNSVKRISLISFFVLLGSVLFAFGLARALVQPIQEIIKGMRSISKGRREPLLFKRRNDEIGWMGQELNKTIHQLKELDEMKENFVTGITHDLKSPLKAIQAFVTRLFDNQGKYTKERNQDYLLIVKNNANRLMLLIDDLLLSAKLEDGKETLDRQKFDLNEACKEIGKLFIPLSEEKGLHLNLTPSTERLFVNADKDKIMHVMSNLISNAVKYTDQGSISVLVIREESIAKIQIIDSGQGIPDQDKKHIFDKFYRSQSNSKLAKGTGLGLFIVKKIVEAHGGTVDVVDNEGKGSIFTLSLPSSDDHPF